MKALKNKEMKSMSVSELESRLLELRKELMKENAQVAMRTVPKSPGSLKIMKKTVARIIAQLSQKSVKQ